MRQPPKCVIFSVAICSQSCQIVYLGGAGGRRNRDVNFNPRRGRPVAQAGDWGAPPAAGMAGITPAPGAGDWGAPAPQAQWDAPVDTNWQ